MIAGLFLELWNTVMSYTTFSYFALVIICFIVYHLFPKQKRWTVLLAGSMLFYYLASGKNLKTMLVFLLTIVVSYAGGILIARSVRHKKAVLWISIILSAVPLLVYKGNDFVVRPVTGHALTNIIIPLGVSFYTLQIISYLADIYHDRIIPQRNFFKYTLYISFFPQIVQGPIPRYQQLADQLFTGHDFSEREVVRGSQLVLWGFFLKYMIADKAGVVVDTIFDAPMMYQGVYALIGGILYSIQLYTDFLACVCMSRGAAEAFGINMAENFNHPYFAVSVQDFWRRWHISLSSWLRDYVYIPLGGNRKGKTRKYINLLVTFLVSGFWHGNGFRYVAWGLLHAVYQIIGALTSSIRNRLRMKIGFIPDSKAETLWRRFWTSLLVMFAWIIFRADHLKTGLFMIRTIFTVHNPWVLWNDSLLQLGLVWKDWMILIFSILILYKVGKMQERGSVRDRILAQPLIVRWTIYLCAFAVIMVFGTYGFGFNASDFIYRGF